MHVPKHTIICAFWDILKVYDAATFGTLPHTSSQDDQLTFLTGGDFSKRKLTPEPFVAICSG